jgi:two-component system, NtrC family, response regulator AtoC
MSKYTLLVADDEEGVRELFKEICLEEGYNVILASDGAEAVQKARSNLPDVIILDMRMPEFDGMEAFKRIKESLINVPVLFITAYGSPDLAIEAMKQGAFNYITKPFDIEEIKILIKKSLQLRELTKEVASLRAGISQNISQIELIGHSPLMQEIYKTIGKISEKDAPVLLQGENGTGKELIARKIHISSKNKDNEFIIINGQTDDDQFLNELNRHKDLGNSTIYIRNIHILSDSSQLHLMEKLQNKNNRIITSTTVDLKDLVEKNTFQKDLYYLLNVIFINVPSLRERKEDIEELTLYFMNKQSIKYGKILNGLTNDCITYLKKYDWPGNLDELENAITHSLIVTNGTLLSAEDLPIYLIKNDSNEILKEKTNYINLSLQEAIKIFEKEFIINALDSTNWNKTKTSEILGISRKSLFNKMKENNIFDLNNNEPTK